MERSTSAFSSGVPALPVRRARTRRSLNFERSVPKLIAMCDSEYEALFNNKNIETVLTYLKNYFLKNH